MPQVPEAAADRSRCGHGGPPGRPIPWRGRIWRASRGRIESPDQHAASGRHGHAFEQGQLHARGQLVQDIDEQGGVAGGNRRRGEIGDGKSGGQPYCGPYRITDLGRVAVEAGELLRQAGREQGKPELTTAAAQIGHGTEAGGRGAPQHRLRRRIGPQLPADIAAREAGGAGIAPDDLDRECVEIHRSDGAWRRWRRGHCGLSVAGRVQPGPPGRWAI